MQKPKAVMFCCGFIVCSKRFGQIIALQLPRLLLRRPRRSIKQSPRDLGRLAWEGCTACVGFLHALACGWTGPWPQRCCLVASSGVPSGACPTSLPQYCIRARRNTARTQ
eukprot:4454898-Pleurochrysis_carterae.AAC.8